MLPPPIPSDQELTMKQLVEATRLSAASIKFYMREKLIPPAVPGRPRRAYYDGRHVRRLTTIRALRDVAGLSIEVIRRTLRAIDSDQADSVDVIAPAIDALAFIGAWGADTRFFDAKKDVATAFKKAGLMVRSNAGSRDTIARTLVALRQTGAVVGVVEISRYIGLLSPLAQEEIENERTSAVLLSDKETSLELAILGTVLFEPLIVGMRRALHEHFTTRLVRKTKRPKLKARKRRRTLVG